jgi:hypothetical protein
VIRGADIKRLKTELATIWEAIFDSLQEENPKASKKELREMTRARFLTVVDEAAREVAQES